MKVYLIRHAETVHNVAQAWAGTTDSPLTSHGILQIERLARYFAAKQTRFSHVFSSDLQRAVATAEGICESTRGPGSDRPELILTGLLQEQHFGSREGTVFRKGRHGRDAEVEVEAGFVPAETERAMRSRAVAFLNSYFLPVLLDGSGTVCDGEQAVAIVAHGIILRVLWNCLCGLFAPGAVRTSPEAEAAARVPFWSNTGFMEVLIELDAAHSDTERPVLPDESVLSGWTMTVQSIDSKPHLAGLRRTRGGIGSMQHDTNQKRIDTFFRRGHNQ